ncbi:Transcriptional regulator, TetR family [Pseudonocardia sp. Ae168_Ps1]|nr:Transcriptional regulator, TetR family [Pseudonocardia sp. Ae150A_Ps1]OLL81610.1 Transcriptional regulator, TetR family [Pseudonocardia sp. Ae168_Ps1]OLL84276.1 Transcriptional regulator, TetR family [Pseudonocardia sp. Ae263_Ps1]OLL95705.1 Transcriptional regulator, TetR family [Pseudonocardia sp. Ae356_Ps1]
MMTVMDRAEQDREGLLDAALQQWVDGGWPAVDPVAAAARAGLPGTAAAEFPTGADLVCAVFDAIVDERAAAMLQAAASAPTPVHRFRAVMAAMLDDVARDPRRVVVLADAFGCPPLVARRRSANRGFGELMAAQPIDTRVGPDDLRLAGHFVMGGIAEIVLAWLDPASPVDRERAVDHGARLMEACATAH